METMSIEGVDFLVLAYSFDQTSISGAVAGRCGRVFALPSGWEREWKNAVSSVLPCVPDEEILMSMVSSISFQSSSVRNDVKFVPRLDDTGSKMTVDMVLSGALGASDVVSVEETVLDVVERMTGFRPVRFGQTSASPSEGIPLPSSFDPWSSDESPDFLDLVPEALSALERAGLEKKTSFPGPERPKERTL